MAPTRPLRLVVIGGKAQVQSLHKGLCDAGLAAQISLVASAGRVTGTLLGQALADAAVIIIDREAGLSAETRRECLMAWGLGAAPILAIENSRSGQGDPTLIAEAFAAWARRLGAPEPELVPLETPPVKLIENLRRRSRALAERTPLRLWIEQISPGASGTIISGTLAGSPPVEARETVIMPAAQMAKISAVSVDAQGRTTITLDRIVAAASGMLLASADSRPELADQIAAHVAWTGEQPLLPGRPYRIKIGAQLATVQVSALKHKVNPLDLDPIAARQLAAGELGLCNLSFAAPLLFDPYERGTALGRFELQDLASGSAVGYGRVAFTLRRASNIHWQALSVDKAARASLKHQKPCCLWLTGLSGSGKSTVASLLEKRLNAAGKHTYTLDGDNVRHGLNRDLGFTDADRVENIRRVGEVAKLFVDAGLIVLVSFISPFRAERQMARDVLDQGEFLEIFVDTPLAVCEQRDAKGLYKKARAGALKNFTGIDSPYEPPLLPEIHLRGGEATPETLVDQITRELERRGFV